MGRKAGRPIDRHAGGIGGALFAAFQRFDYDFVCAMLLSIIVLIFLGEVLATQVRAIFLERSTLDAGKE